VIYPVAEWLSGVKNYTVGRVLGVVFIGNLSSDRCYLARFLQWIISMVVRSVRPDDRIKYSSFLREQFIHTMKPGKLNKFGL
jgi:hypothetical protein